MRGAHGRRSAAPCPPPGDWPTHLDRGVPQPWQYLRPPRHRPTMLATNFIPQRSIDVALGNSSPPAGVGAPLVPIPIHASGLPMMELSCIWQISETDPNVGLLNLFVDAL